ncbi:DUF262 domain-containing protein [Salinisphaera sp.]|uniref:DUF262 domain-containing protein n=1 Tax=Salinisphaera sp. TaxID=1914330 RepID=UPI000C56786D|nr:DUF262 domain-containing protein [Salinisphaera sp.]MAS08856.1 hypothetical protein [Salinisphaera sp.]
MNIDANVKSIDKLKDFYFVVPDYQREYVWEADDQVEQFLFDIDAEYDPHVKMPSSYFIGSIIIVERDGHFDVIDGQQRLTTIVISLCVLRDLLRRVELSTREKHYFETIQQWLLDFDIDSDTTRVRLDLQYDESRDFLTRVIHGEPYEGESTASIRRMEKAYERIKAHFALVLDTGLDALVRYARYVLTRIELVVIESENLGSALKIFETINQRGAGLNAMDLVKNLLFSEAREAEFSQIKDTWRRMAKHLEACDEGQSPLRFLKYFLTARYRERGAVLREDEIYKWIISAEGKEALAYRSKPLALARELERMAGRYSELVVATEFYRTGGGDFPCVRHIGYMNKYRSRQHLVLLLALPANASNELIDYLGSQIEAFLFFSNSMGIQGRTNEQLFARWSIPLRDANNEGAVDAAIRETMLVYLRERLSDFRAAFPLLRHTAYNPGYRQRFVLGRMENTLRAMAGMSQHGHDFIQNAQIEHILPQTPQDAWIPAEFEDMDDYQAVVARLGNVALLESTINQAVNFFNDLAGDWFEKKHVEYVKSAFVMSDLLDPNYGIGKDTALNRSRNMLGYEFSTWNRHEIERRQRVMMELAFRTWTLCGERLDAKAEAA